MRKTILVFGIGLSILSCNSKKEELPTEQFAKQKVIETIKLESDDKIELLDFKKTDALKEKVFEVDYYTIDFDGKIVYKQNGYSLANENYNTKKGFLLVKNEKPSIYSYDAYRFKEVKKGQERKITGKIYFIKKENGWDKKDVKMYIVDKIQ